jgi:GT2 family glycosyltransferase
MWLIRGILRRKFELSPVRWSDVERQAHADAWRSTGPLPSIDLQPTAGRFPSGWVVLSLDITVISADTAFAVMRADSGRGYAATAPIRVPRSVQGKHIVRLPDTVKGLQYQPIKGAGRFVLRAVAAQEVCWIEAVIRQMIRYCRGEGLTVRKAIQAALTHMRVHGVKALWTWIRQYTTGERRDAYYGPWVARQEALRIASMDQLRQRADALGCRPTFSVLMPVYKTPEQWLRKAIESVVDQIYPHWELCICDDNSRDRAVDAVLNEYQQKESRIKVVVRNSNGHIAAATNDAMNLATGNLMCLLDHDDAMAPDALLEFAALLNEDPSIDLMYSDEDLISIDNVRYEPILKPAWSPENLESYMYIGHLACYRTSIARAIGGFRSTVSGAQDYDFALRYTERATNIRHVPGILYHWRAVPGSIAVSIDQKRYVIDAAKRALQERLVREGSAGVVEERTVKGWFETRRDLVGEPAVSLIVWQEAPGSDPSREAAIEACRESLQHNTGYRHFEIIVVAPGANMAQQLNEAADRAAGEYLVFLSDATRIASPHWLEDLLRYSQRPGVGVTGPKLLFADNSLRHGGIVFCNGLPRRVRMGYPRSDWGYWGSSAIARNYLAVSHACMMVRRQRFSSVGKFDPTMSPFYHHFDLCLRIVEAGERVVYVPSAELYDLGQDPSSTEHDDELFRKRWRHLTDPDPFYGANLTMDPPTFDFEGRGTGRR